MRWGFGTALLAAGLAACATAPRTASSGSGDRAAAGGEWVRRIDPFPVADENGRPYALPFLGGFNAPRPQLWDADGDGDPDLFVQERSGELTFLENTGTRAAPRFAWRTDRWQGLDVGEWSRFADVDGDGLADLLAEAPFSYVRYWRNTGTAAQPRFTLAADTVRDTAGAPIFADRQNIPSVVDVDCNGLPDLFLGRVDGTVTRYEMAPPRAQAPPRFRFVQDRWQGIEIIGQVTPDAGPPEQPGAGRPSMHGANAMAFLDVDADGDPDLLWGDFFEPGVLLLENTGTCAAPLFTAAPRSLTAGGAPLATSGYNVAVPGDLDGDGALDLLLGVLGGAFNPNRTAADNLWHLEREGEGLSLRTTRLLGGVDVGAESAPALADLDGDGDLDLLVGNKLDPAALRHARLYRFENTGTPWSPAFALADTLVLGSAYHYAPALGDLDGDGDPDLVVGTWNEGVLVHWNRGDRTRFAPAAQAETLAVLTRGSNATPALGDVDGDGDLDLLVGEASGTLNFFRNDGTRTAPRFVLASDEFLGIDAGRRSHPALADVDGDSRPDLVVGREERGVLFFRNISRGSTVAFQPAPMALPLLPYGAPALADLNGDARLEVIAGTLTGGLLYFARQ